MQKDYTMGEDGLIFGEPVGSNRHTIPLDHESFSEFLFSRIHVHGKRTFMVNTIVKLLLLYSLKLKFLNVFEYLMAGNHSLAPPS